MKAATDTMAGSREIPEGFLRLPHQATFVVQERTFLKLSNHAFVSVRFEGDQLIGYGTTMHPALLAGLDFSPMPPAETAACRERNQLPTISQEIRRAAITLIGRGLHAFRVPHA